MWRILKTLIWSWSFLIDLPMFFPISFHILVTFLEIQVQSHNITFNYSYFTAPSFKSFTLHIHLLSHYLLQSFSFLSAPDSTGVTTDKEMSLMHLWSSPLNANTLQVLHSRVSLKPFGSLSPELYFNHFPQHPYSHSLNSPSYLPDFCLWCLSSLSYMFQAVHLISNTFYI